jgi:hypothetical protein
MWSKKTYMLLLVARIVPLLLASSCVTQTEQVSPYEQERDESAWDELRREFGWKNDNTAAPAAPPTEPFYRRAAHKITETVSGWFADDEAHLSEQERAADRYRFEPKRAEVPPRLRMQQTDAEREENNE